MSVLQGFGLRHTISGRCRIRAEPKQFNTAGHASTAERDIHNVYGWRELRVLNWVASEPRTARSPWERSTTL